MKDSQYTETELNQLFPKQLPVEHTEEYKQRQALWQKAQKRKEWEERKQADEYRRKLWVEALFEFNWEDEKSLDTAIYWAKHLLQEYDNTFHPKP